MRTKAVPPHRNHLALAEPSKKVMLAILQRHIRYLDAIGIDIRLRHRTIISRAAIIRALIDFMQQSGIDFRRFQSIDEMVPFLVERFRALQDANAVTRT